jgi:hypothetical protein
MGGRTDAGSGEVLQRGTAEGAGADDEHGGVAQPELGCGCDEGDESQSSSFSEQRGSGQQQC